MDYTAFKSNLRTLISSRGMTILQLAEEIGIPAPTISRYLAGEREPKLHNIVKLSQFFNVSIDWLLGLNGEKYDVMPKEIQDVAACYSLASPDDRRVVQAVLQKYRP